MVMWSTWNYPVLNMNKIYFVDNDNYLLIDGGHNFTSKEIKFQLWMSDINFFIEDTIEPYKIIDRAYQIPRNDIKSPVSLDVSTFDRTGSLNIARLGELWLNSNIGNLTNPKGAFPVIETVYSEPIALRYNNNLIVNVTVTNKGNDSGKFKVVCNISSCAGDTLTKSQITPVISPRNSHSLSFTFDYQSILDTAMHGFVYVVVNTYKESAGTFYPVCTSGYFVEVTGYIKLGYIDRPKYAKPGDSVPIEVYVDNKGQNSDAKVEVYDADTNSVISEGTVSLCRNHFHNFKFTTTMPNRDLNFYVVSKHNELDIP